MFLSDNLVQDSHRRVNVKWLYSLILSLPYYFSFMRSFYYLKNIARVATFIGKFFLSFRPVPYNNI